MIKKFSEFNEYFHPQPNDGHKVNEDANAQYLIANIDLVPGSPEHQQARSFISSMCAGKLPGISVVNVGTLANFCIDNYYLFQKPDEAGPLKPYINNIKIKIKEFFLTTEVESPNLLSSDQVEDYIVDAVFKNVKQRSGWGKGMLQLFFEAFQYIWSNPDSMRTGLNSVADQNILKIIQEIKETWDPEGWDAYAVGLGGDSDPILYWKKQFRTVFGNYAIQRGALLTKREQEQERGTATVPVVQQQTAVAKQTAAAAATQTKPAAVRRATVVKKQPKKLSLK